MHAPLSRLRHGLRAVLLAGVTVALLGTQAIGLHHRIEHGTVVGWVNPAAGAWASPLALNGTDLANATPAKVDHHCAAIDALALSDGLPASSLPIIVTSASPQSIAAPQSSPLPSARRQPFQARAPPALLS